MGFAFAWPILTKVLSRLAESRVAVGADAPIRRQSSIGNKSMNAGMRPIDRVAYVAMLDRIEVHVIDMAAEVIIVADQVFPIPPLPDAALALGDTTIAPPFALGHCAGEAGLDQPPSQGMVGIVRRQRPDGVQVFGQHHHGVDCERMSKLYMANGITQLIDAVGQKGRSPIGEIDREEISRARGTCASVVGHP